MAAGAVERILLGLLLEKYEGSKVCLAHPEKATVLPQINFENSYKKKLNQKKSKYKMEKLLDYQTTNSSVLHAYNEAAEHLQQLGFLQIEYDSGGAMLKVLRLQLSKVEQAYAYLGLASPRQQVETWVGHLAAFAGSEVAWLKTWQERETALVLTEHKLSAEQKKLLDKLPLLCRSFQRYVEQQGQPITMRSFSIKCFNDSKFFEKVVCDDFLKIAVQYDEELNELQEESELRQEPLGKGEQLACLGIFVRPEVYELSGCCQILTDKGMLDLQACYPYGLGILSTSLKDKLKFNLSGIKKIICIENKTCYDEFLLQEMDRTTLAFYLGGFASPFKSYLLAKLQEAAAPDMVVYLWSDIDMGGFKIFNQLQEIFPQLRPYRMGVAELDQYAAYGLARNEQYLSKLQQSQGKYPLFVKVIEKILQYGVTIEQEVFYQNK